MVDGYVVDLVEIRDVLDVVGEFFAERVLDRVHEDGFLVEDQVSVVCCSSARGVAVEVAYVPVYHSNPEDIFGYCDFVHVSVHLITPSPFSNYRLSSRPPS